MSRDELISIADNWINIEDDILESTEVDDDPEPEVDVLAATIDDNDKLINAQAEDMVSQLKFNCKHLGVDEDAFNHLDQFIRLVSEYQSKEECKTRQNAFFLCFKNIKPSFSNE